MAAESLNIFLEVLCDRSGKDLNHILLEKREFHIFYFCNKLADFRCKCCWKKRKFEKLERAAFDIRVMNGGKIRSELLFQASLTCVNKVEAR